LSPVALTDTPNMNAKDARTIAAVGVAGIALMGILGTLYSLDIAPKAFDLDDEYTVPAFYSGILLALAAWMVFRLGRQSEGSTRLLLQLGALFLAFLALDEVFSVHERINDHTGIDWQLLYTPPALAFGWGVWRITGEFGRRSPEALMIFAGVAMWLVAQVLEAAAWSHVLPSLIDTDTMSQAEIRHIRHGLGYQAMSIPEELLEMGGSLLFAVAFARLASRRETARH
jgi:hypothetical protein